MGFNRVHRTAVILFFGLSAFYLSLSPSSIAGQGYTGEEINSGLRMLAVLNAWLKGRPIPAMVWSRHGPIPVLFDLPFIKLGKIFVSPDFVLSFQPVLLTAALLTVLYLWLRKLCSPGMSLLLTLTGAFCTMLWPYAYISLETKQSLFILLAGYLGIARKEIRSWPRLLLFAVTSGLAVSLKANGIVLFPVLAYLAYVQFRVDWHSRRMQVLVAVCSIGFIWGVGALGRAQYWGPRGGGFSVLRSWFVDSPFYIFSNLIGIFGSPTKGLFVYAPVLLLALHAIPRTFRTQRQTVMFALLVTGCTLGLLCPLRTFADEVWGSRYMHVTICPLLLCIGAARPCFNRRRIHPCSLWPLWAFSSLSWGHSITTACRTLQLLERRKTQPSGLRETQSGTILISMLVYSASGLKEKRPQHCGLLDITGSGGPRLGRRCGRLWTSGISASRSRLWCVSGTSRRMASS
jgi:hypothetical protein